MHWNDRLRQERIWHNWRQQDLADHLGATVLTVQRWERGSHQPGAYFRVKLCALFGKSAQELSLVGVDATQSAVPEHGSSAATPPPALGGDAGILWTVPYPRNPHFTGRDTFLNQLERDLSPDRSKEPMTSRRTVLANR